MDLTIAHRILGVNSSSTQDQVKNAYKNLVKKWHPDRHINDKIKYAYAEENIKKIIEEYKFLLNHISWEKRNDFQSFKKQKFQFGFKSFIIKIVSFITIFIQYMFILIGLPFIIFWYHPIHVDLFPYFHNIEIEKTYDINEKEIFLSFKNTDSLNFFENDSIKLDLNISLVNFLDLLMKNNKSNTLQYIDFDNDGHSELIINIFSNIIDDYFHLIMLFSYNEDNEFNFIKKFENGTIIDYGNQVFIEPLSVFDSFYFCDSCYFSTDLINDKNIKYISPKVRYVYNDNQIFYQNEDRTLNKKIINNLNSLSKLDFIILNKKFDTGIRRLYAENILSYYYNSFDLNEARDLFYSNYNFSDKHNVWKKIVVELIKEYPILRNDEII